MNEDALRELPGGWVWTRLEDACIELIGGGTPSRKIPEYFGGNIIWLTPTEIPKNKIEILRDSKEKITESGLKDSSARIIPKDSVLLTSRASIGYVAIAGCEVTTNQGFASFVCSNAIYNFFLAHWLWVNKRLLESNATGTTFKEISKSKLREFYIPLPPLPEQRAIVSKIEQLFSDMDNGIKNFKKAQEQLKRYRQAVLRYAFEGKLTESWRAAHKNEIEPASVLLEHIKNETEKNAKRELKELPSIDTSMLPEGWVYDKLEHLIYIAGRIGWRGLKAEEYTDDGPLFLSVYNLNKGYNVDFSEVYHISEERYNESPEIQLKNDDILLVKDGSGIGKLGIVKGLKTEATVNSSLLVIRSGKFFVPEYLFYFFKGPNMQRVVKERITGSATPHLFQRDIKKFELLIPPIKEQEKIVEEIERRLSISDKMEATITESLQKAESLRQSILKKAFEGKLLNEKEMEEACNAPDWEPAEKLLERIRQEKEIKRKNKRNT